MSEEENITDTAADCPPESALLYANIPVKLAAYTFINGYVGMGEVFVTVLAESEQSAFKEATRHFRESAKIYNHPSSYWENLKLSEVNYLETYPCVVTGSDG